MQAEATDGEEENTKKSSKESNNSSASTRNHIKSRNALFDGSRRSSSNSNSNKDDEEDEDKNNKGRSRILHECEASVSIAQPQMSPNDQEAPEPSNVLCSIEGNLEDLNDISQILPPPITTAVDIANSTQADNIQLPNPMFDMSVLKGISRITYSFWESAKNVSLFGRDRARNLDDSNEISISSELSGLPDISEMSLNITIQNTAILEENMLESKTPDNEEDQDDTAEPPKIIITDDEVQLKTFSGLATPEITPISFKLKSRQLSKARIRTTSEGSPLGRTGPYDIPPEILLRKKLRANLKTRASHFNETPKKRRTRNWSESLSSPLPGQLEEIDCVRIRDRGLYDSSDGLGEYFYLETDYLDKRDTAKIDKERLMKDVRKALSISGDETPSMDKIEEHSVCLAWNEEDIENVSRSQPSFGQSPLTFDRRNPLLHLLGRIINHTSRLWNHRPNYNGLKISLLPEITEKFPLDRLRVSEDQPTVLLHLGGKCRSVNIISKKLDPQRSSVFDVELENGSLLTIFPKTSRNMNINIASEGAFTGDFGGHNILISPCFIPSEDVTNHAQGLEHEAPSQIETLDKPNSTIRTPINIVSKDDVAKSGKFEEEGVKGLDIDTSTNSAKANPELEDAGKNLIEQPGTPSKIQTNSNEEDQPVTDDVDKSGEPEEKGVKDLDKDTFTNSATANLELEDAGKNLIEQPVTSSEIQTNSNGVDQPVTDVEVSIPQVTPCNVDNCTANERVNYDGDLNADSPDTTITQTDHMKGSVSNSALTEESLDAEDKQPALPEFISQPTYMHVVDRLNSKPLINWVKLCKLKPAHTAEQNKQILQMHLLQVSQKKCLLPPSIVENITKKLNDDAVRYELDTIGLKPAKNARSRKNQLQTYLIENFTAINLADRLNDFKLEKSRIGKKKKRKDKNKTLNSISKNKGHGKTDRVISEMTGVPTISDGTDPTIKEDPDGAGEGANEEPHEEAQAEGTEALEKLPIPIENKEEDKEDSTRPAGKVDKDPAKATEATQALKNFDIENLQKPLRTLEENLLKLQDTTSQQQLRLDILDGSPNYMDSDVRRELSELRSKMDSVLKTIEIQQNTLNTLVESKTKSSASAQTETIGEESNTQPDLHDSSKSHQDNKCKNCDCSLQISQIFCILAMIWNQTEHLRKNSYPASIQKAAVDSDHSYCKTRSEKPVLPSKVSPIKNGNITIENEPAPSPTEPVIFQDEDIVVCGSTDIVMSTDEDPDAPELTKPIPVITAASSDSNALSLPIRVKANSSKTDRGKCLILHECPSTAVNDEKLSPFFDLECEQIQSLKDITSKKNLLKLENRVRDAKPSVIFVHLGKSDLRNNSTANVIQCYEKLLKSMIKVTDADICATMLQQTHGYPKQNKNVNQFNVALNKLVSHMRTLQEPNGSCQIYIEDESYVLNGIGSQSVIKDVFPFIEQPDSPTASASAPQKGNVTLTTETTAIPVLGRANVKETKDKLVTSHGAKRLDSVCRVEEKVEDNPGYKTGDENTKAKEKNSKPAARHPHVKQQQPDKSKKVYHKRKCLLVFDNLLNDFNSQKFSTQFDISKYEASSVEDLLSKGGLIAKAHHIKPEVILLHVGLHDLFWHKTDADDLVGKYQKIIKQLLEATDAKICVSLIVPVPGYPGLNDNITAVNTSLVALISKMRSSQPTKRVFTSCNKQLGGFITRGTGSHGITLFLSEGGKRKAWLLLKDALQRTLGISRDRDRKLNISYGHSHSTHKEPKYV